MIENKCPYCHGTVDKCESAKLLFIDKQIEKSIYNYVAKVWIYLDQLHFEVMTPMLAYRIRFEFLKISKSIIVLCADVI